jgi:hypothetical protein
MYSAEESLDKLLSFIEQENYKGWDPYDGLNSKIFQSIKPISNNRLMRLAWIQFFKRSPVNFRKITGVPKEYNSKGIALFLAGYCKLYQINNQKIYLDKINFFANLLLQLSAKGWSGYCWGYNFDWQARAFFQPKNTPTVVASVYAASALIDAYTITQNNEYLNAALSCANFVLKDLNRNYDADGDFCFSYSPLDKSIVYNASLLGSKLLSKAYSLTGNEEYIQEASKSVNFCIKNQHKDGSWAYGQQPFHYWIDNFHTGFNLECLYVFNSIYPQKNVEQAINKGFEYYITTFFDEEGKAKYYNNKTYPIDIHAPSQLIVTLDTLHRFKQYEQLANKVLMWTIKNMQHPKGYFYYQINKFTKSKIPYMRWAQAWMFYALSIYKKNLHESRTI